MDELPLFPLVGFEVQIVPKLGILFIRLPFLTSPLQPIEQADPGRRYAIHPRQAREIARSILEAADALESAGGQGEGMPKH
jgi:hypothetical protein